MTTRFLFGKDTIFYSWYWMYFRMSKQVSTQNKKTPMEEENITISVELNELSLLWWELEDTVYGCATSWRINLLSFSSTLRNIICIWYQLYFVIASIVNIVFNRTTYTGLVSPSRVIVWILSSSLFTIFSNKEGS
jgi:hypothetical protein